MSWLSDRFNDAAYGIGTLWKNTTSLGGHFENDVSRFFENELVNKSQLRGSQAEAILSGVPIVGDILKGFEGASQMEDLYNNTGKVVQYPANQSLGASSLGSLSRDLPSKIEGGTHDLYKHYTGDTDDTLNRVGHGTNNHHMLRPNHYHTRMN